MDEEFDTYEAPDFDMDYSSDDSGAESSDFSNDSSFDAPDFSEDRSNDIDYGSESMGDSTDFSEDTETMDGFDDAQYETMNENFNEDSYEDNENFEDGPKVLTRDEHELLTSGYNNVEQQLDVLADDYRDKGYSESDIESMLASDRYRLQQDFLNDAFPGQEVTPHVFNGFRENGSRAMMNDIENYEGVREILAPGTESSVGSDYDTIDFPEDTDDYLENYEESIDGDFETLDFSEDTETEIDDSALDSTFDNEADDFAEDIETIDGDLEPETDYETEAEAETQAETDEYYNNPEYSEGEYNNTPEHSEQILPMDENNPEHSEQITAEESYEALDESDLEVGEVEMSTPMGEVNEDGSIDVEHSDEGFESTDNEPVHSESVDNEPLDLSDIDYDAIYEGIEADALAEGFKDVNLDTDTERLNASLGNFESSNWENLSLDDQKESMQNLADYVSEITGIENPPKIEYYNNEQEGDFGGYDPSTNTLQVNEYMLYNSDEAADTIAHELWHCHQHERAENPQSALDFQYQHNFDNYIRPELDQQAYEDQLVEAEARAFANQFKDRLKALRGG